MDKRKYIYLAVAGVLLAGCEFDVWGNGQGSMAAVPPTVSEKNIACIRAKANMRAMCASKCTAPKTGNMTLTGECFFVPDATNMRVIADVAGRCECS